jgi:glycosyltransferase involved in cell wall biosynthesis
MKILIVNAVFPPEPVVSAQIGYDLALELSLLGDTVSVFSPRPTRPMGFSFNSIKSRFFKEFNFIESQSYVCPKSSLFGRFFESLSFGIHSFYYIFKNRKVFNKVYINSWPIFGVFGASLACMIFGIKYYIHIQDLYPESFTNKSNSKFKLIINNIFYFFEKFYLQNAQGVIVISEKMKTIVSNTRKISFEKIGLVYNWQSYNYIEGEGVNPVNQRTYMYLGNIGPIAGLERIIKVFAGLGSQNRLVIAGNGSQKALLMNLVKDLACNNVEFIDVPNGEVELRQSKADILILPMISGSSFSSIPSKLPSYMLSGRPIIAMVDQGSDTQKVILDSGCGWVGEYGDDFWLGDIFQLTSQLDSEILLEKGNRGRNYAQIEFSKSANLSKLISIIKAN